MFHFISALRLCHNHFLFSFKAPASVNASCWLFIYIKLIENIQMPESALSWLSGSAMLRDVSTSFASHIIRLASPCHVHFYVLLIRSLYYKLVFCTRSHVSCAICSPAKWIWKPQQQKEETTRQMKGKKKRQPGKLQPWVTHVVNPGTKPKKTKNTPAKYNSVHCRETCSLCTLTNWNRKFWLRSTWSIVIASSRLSPLSLCAVHSCAMSDWMVYVRHLWPVGSSCCPYKLNPTARFKPHAKEFLWYLRRNVAHAKTLPTNLFS